MDLKTLKLLEDTPPWEWPRNAAAMFLGVLRDDGADEESRLIAAELAGNSTVIDDNLAAALLSIVRDGGVSEKLRTTAALALGPALELADNEIIAGDLGDMDDSPISRSTFQEIQKSLRRIYMDEDIPKDLRRRILEASVRAPQDWHRMAIGSAYASGDEAWKLTAVFCMRWVKGFDREILQALESRNSQIEYEAVCAAGNWELAGAWPHVTALLTNKSVDKPLLLAAIEAAAGIRPEEAGQILVELTDSDDEDISDAAYEAMAMAAGAMDNDFDDEDDDFDDDDDFDEDDDLDDVFDEFDDDSDEDDDKNGRKDNLVH